MRIIVTMCVYSLLLYKRLVLVMHTILCCTPCSRRAAIVTDCGRILLLLRRLRRWDDHLAKWLHSNDPNGVGASGEFTLWHNLNHPSLLPGSHTLLSFLGDPQSSHYEGLPDETVKAALMKRLRAQFPNRTIPPPSDFFISRHGYDKNTYRCLPALLLPSPQPRIFGWKASRPL